MSGDINSTGASSNDANFGVMGKIVLDNFFEQHCLCLGFFFFLKYFFIKEVVHTFNRF
jgi:hypothetical protein